MPNRLDFVILVRMYSPPGKFLWPVANLKFDAQDVQCLRTEGTPTPCNPYSKCSPEKS